MKYSTKQYKIDQLTIPLRSFLLLFLENPSRKLENTKISFKKKKKNLVVQNWYNILDITHVPMRKDTRLGHDRRVVAFRARTLLRY